MRKRELSFFYYRDVIFAGVNDTGFKVYEVDKYGQEHTGTEIQDQNELHVTCVAVSVSLYTNRILCSLCYLYRKQAVWQ